MKPSWNKIKAAILGFAAETMVIAGIFSIISATILLGIGTGYVIGAQHEGFVKQMEMNNAAKKRANSAAPAARGPQMKFGVMENMAMRNMRLNCQKVDGVKVVAGAQQKAMRILLP